MNKKIMSVLMLVALITTSTVIPAFAYTQEELDILTGPSTGISCTIEADGKSGKPQPGAGPLVNAIENDDGTYTFEGHRYATQSSWGQHCLTGYAATGNCTASGTMPRVYHTASGPRKMKGSVILVKGAYLRSDNGGNVSAYDGIYVLEDTGGDAVETGTDSTMNVPVVDIYVETPEAARAVTALGGIVADVYILTRVD